MTAIERLRGALAESFDSLDVRDFGLLAWDAAPALLAEHDAAKEWRDAQDAHDHAVLYVGRPPKHLEDALWRARKALRDAIAACETSGSAEPEG